MKFIITGWDGKPHECRGTHVDTERNGTLIVRLTKDDAGGFGTYRTGDEIRVSPHEIVKQQPRKETDQ